MVALPLRVCCCSTMLRAAGCLEALNSCIQGGATDRAGTTELLVNAVCRLLSGCAHACASTGMPHPAPKFLAWAQFVLRSGSTTQQHLLRAFEDGTVDAAVLIASLASQGVALDCWLALASQTVRAEASMPPELLHQWVCQALNSLCAVTRRPWRPGEWRAVQVGCGW